MDEQTVTEVTEPEVKEEVKETEAQAPEETKTEEQPSDKTEKEKEEYSRRVQARIDKLHAEKMEAKLRAERAEARLAEVEAGKGSKPARPSMASFSDEYGNIDHAKYDAAVSTYDEALLTWHDHQKIQQESKTRQQVEAEAIHENFFMAADSARAKYPDFDQIMAKEIFTPELTQVLLENRAVELAYYLGKNENEAKKIGSMPERQMMLELGRLEGKLSSLQTRPSNAPKPITPVSDDKGESIVDESKLTDEEWFEMAEKKRLALIKKRLGG